jgi:transcriptional regulator with XRE-family HTH domain
VREWRGTRQKDLAAQLGTKRQAWAQLELSEQRDAISLYSLRKAARALDCDVVYYLVPRAGTETPVDAIAVAPASGTSPSKPAEKPAATGWFNDDLRTELL